MIPDMPSDRAAESMFYEIMHRGHSPNYSYLNQTAEDIEIDTYVINRVLDRRPLLYGKVNNAIITMMGPDWDEDRKSTYEDEIRAGLAATIAVAVSGNDDTAPDQPVVQDTNNDAMAVGTNGAHIDDDGVSSHTITAPQAAENLTMTTTAETETINPTRPAVHSEQRTNISTYPTSVSIRSPPIQAMCSTNSRITTADIHHLADLLKDNNVAHNHADVDVQHSLQPKANIPKPGAAQLNHSTAGRSTTAFGLLMQNIEVFTTDTLLNVEHIIEQSSFDLLTDVADLLREIKKLATAGQLVARMT